MGQQNVKAPVAYEREAQLADTGIHFALCILIGAIFVAHGAAETENAHTAKIIDSILDADAAFRRVRVIFGIMIAMDVQYGRFGKAGQK